MKDYIFLEYSRIVQLHSLALLRYGGTEGIRDKNLIESAIAQPCATFAETYLHQDIIEMAAAYYFHLSQNQGFVDGNKRTGFLAMFAFLKLNGYDLTVPDVYLWPILKRVANNEMDKESFSNFLRENCVKLQLQE